MPTTRCPQCKRAIEPTTAVCPHCRRARGKPVGLWLAIAAAVALCGVLALGAAGLTAYWLTAEVPSPPPVAEAKKKSKPAAPPPQAALPRVEPKVEPPGPKVELPPVKEAALPTADPQALQELNELLLRQLNTYRKTAGLDAVRLDPELCKGCAAHARYLALNPPTPTTRLLEEEPGKPGYSDAGRQAAGVAMVSISAAKNAVEQWLGRLSGRVPLLNPELGAIGLGVEPMPEPNPAWAIVIDPVRGIGSAEPPVVVYPAPGQSGVPVTFAGGPEVPDAEKAAGYPVTVTFPPQRSVSEVKAELLDDAGKAVDAWLSMPDKGQRNNVALVPKAPLRGARVYKAHVTVNLAGKPWSKTWSFTTEDDTDRKGVLAEQAVAKVNAVRKAAGLAPVTLDAELSRACLAHARYLVLNLGQPATVGLGAHDEDLSLPGATPAGKNAGLKSNINIGDVSPLDGVDAWMATLYHRVPILEPTLKKVGFACARARWLGWVTVLNVHSGKEPNRDRTQPVFYPAPDQTGVPLHFPVGGEVPDPIPEDKTGRAGYPITAFFPFAAPLRSASLTLTDEAGKAVPGWSSSAEAPANPKYAKNQGNTICLIPKEPLRPNTTYHVQLRGQRNGMGWQKAWQFSTGGAGPSVADAAAEVHKRLNVYRAAAGLGAVTLDTALSRGCQAHAEYLLRNRAEIAAKKLPANDESPDLPGYTAEGKLASRQSHVFSRAPRPVAQLEYIMGSVQWRSYLLDPRVRRIGVGFANDVGRGWRCVLDPFGGRGGERIVLYPVPDQEAVPCAGFDRLPGETNPLGYPISVTFPPQVKLLGGKGTLTDADGKPVETVLATPEQPLNPAVPLRNALCLYPRAPLTAAKGYTVTLSAVVNGQQWRQRWQFTTE